MKTFLLFSTLLFSCFIGYSKATVCTTSSNQCMEIDRLSDDGGLTWFNACCSHLTLLPGQTCTDDCEPPSKPFDNNPIKGISDQFKHSLTLDNGAITNSLYTLRANKLLLNGAVICEFPTGTNGVVFTLSNGETVALRQSDIKETDSKLLFHVPKINILEFEKEVMRASIFISPNPINARNESLNLQSSIEILRIEVIDLYGRVHYIDNEKWEGIKSIYIDVLPGIYILRLKTTKTSIYFDKKIIVYN